LSKPASIKESCNMTRRRARSAHVGGLGRREFLGRAGALAGALAFSPALLAACGGDDDDSSSGNGGGDRAVSISNWPDYMTDESKSAFERATGLKLTYTEDINDNNDYFAKIRPNLSQGDGIGRDGIVLTDWMASRLINQVEPPWVQKLDAAAFPNKKNLIESLRSPAFDPKRDYSAPWVVGITGIAYNIKITGKEIKTLDDFLTGPGTRTVLTEMRDTVGIFMSAAGADVEKPTFAAAEPAFDRLEKAVSDGQIAGFNGNEYVNDLGAGNLAAAFAWSGDVAQIALENPDVRFAIPESGGMLWSDTFLVPIGTDRVEQATEFINFFYDPKNSAQLMAGIQYISPVEGVADELTKLGGEAAALVDNPLVVPTDAFLENLSQFGVLDEQEEEKFDNRFSEILGAG
jgi:spermidine/putrescine transport system substrate-binding protein